MVCVGSEKEDKRRVPYVSSYYSAHHYSDTICYLSGPDEGTLLSLLFDSVSKDATRITDKAFKAYYTLANIATAALINSVNLQDRSRTVIHHPARIAGPARQFFRQDRLLPTTLKLWPPDQ